MDNNNSSVIWFASLTMIAIVLTVFVNVGNSDYNGSSYTKQETYFKLQQRPSKLIQ